MQAEDEVIGPQARDVSRGVPARERVVEIVRQEDGFEVGSVPDLRRPHRSASAE